MSGRTFLDTNVLVYLFDRDEPEKRERARGVLESGGYSPFVVSTQVLGEFYVTLTRKLTPRIDPDVALAAVRRFSDFSVVSMDVSLVHRAIDTAKAAQLSYWDALILEAAASAGSSRILTEDLAAGSVLRGVRIENPFATPSS